ncbi:hypothetical protein BT96DRAFT_226828 [Gymnopus androsaceus JB14]|uniref:Uncharacterized protein n=1 Tax=Gymnopus androsaceus JB14 TaxID=1447944 RepID=A0A6A4H514_9AGAR|nr:hypothetical protein BT96DRAFT_226828 [Gymnopus androsaceus JB14]
MRVHLLLRASLSSSSSTFSSAKRFFKVLIYVLRRSWPAMNIAGPSRFDGAYAASHLEALSVTDSIGPSSGVYDPIYRTNEPATVDLGFTPGPRSLRQRCLPYDICFSTGGNMNWGARVHLLRPLPFPRIPHLRFHLLHDTSSVNAQSGCIGQYEERYFAQGSMHSSGNNYNSYDPRYGASTSATALASGYDHQRQGIDDQ